MTSTTAFLLKSSVFDRERQLILTPEYLEFDDKDLATSAATKFLKEEIEAIKYGVTFIRGLSFYIGRTYCIDIKNNSGKIIKLRLKTIYRIGRKQLEFKYVQVVEALYRYYFSEIGGRYLKLFHHNQPFELLGVNFNSAGICFDKNTGTIPWDLLRIRKYWTYFSLFSASNPHDYKAFNYVEQWNAPILQVVTEEILKMKVPAGSP